MKNNAVLLWLCSFFAALTPQLIIHDLSFEKQPEWAERGTVHNMETGAEHWTARDKKLVTLAWFKCTHLTSVSKNYLPEAVI